MQIEQIRTKLKSLENKQKAEKSKSYLKSQYSFYGISMPELRKIAKECKLEFIPALNLFDELWNSGNHEEMSLALFIINKYVKKHPNEVWKFLLQRLEKAKSWDHIDELSCHILGEILVDNINLTPETSKSFDFDSTQKSLISDIKKMSESKNPWIRRTSIVSCYPLIKKQRLELIFLLAEKLVYDDDIYVQKGAGWMLREAGKRNRLALREFLMMHLNMKPVAFSYATEKMKELRKIKKEKMKNKINLEEIKQSKSIAELLQFSIINLDKPAGPTSFGVDEIVKNALGLTKASHFGTLDPAVTGVLPLALNRACRLMPYFIGKNKEYIGIMKLHQKIDEKKLKEEIKKFIGKIKQLPPVKSRVKREERERKVYNFEILEFDKENKEVLFKTEVEAGTYIRKLIHDIGKSLEIGAHMLELRRTKACIFSEIDKNFTNLYKLEEAIKEYQQGKEESIREVLIPGEIIADILPTIQVKEESLKKLHNGSPLFSEFLQDEKDEQELPDIFIIFSNNIFIGVYKKAVEGNILAKPEFVLKL